jgi:glutamate racemase
MSKSAETGEDIRVYTPLQVYRTMGRRYGRVGVMAANNISAHGIEEAFMASNPDLYVIGTGNMSIVRAIEDGVAPAEIVERCGLKYMMAYMEACAAEAIVLGCTHFPYLKEELAKVTDLPLIDPADEMYKAMLER